MKQSLPQIELRIVPNWSLSLHIFSQRLQIFEWSNDVYSACVHSPRTDCLSRRLKDNKVRKQQGEYHVSPTVMWTCPRKENLIASHVNFAIDQAIFTTLLHTLSRGSLPRNLIPYSSHRFSVPLLTNKSYCSCRKRKHWEDTIRPNNMSHDFINSSSKIRVDVSEAITKT